MQSTRSSPHPGRSVLVQAYKSTLGRLVQALEEISCKHLCNGPNSSSSTAHLGQHAVPLLPCHWQHLGWADQSPQVGHTVLNVAAPGQWCARWREQRSTQGRNAHQPFCCCATDCNCPPAAVSLTATALRPWKVATRGPALFKGVGTGVVTDVAQPAQPHRMVVAYLWDSLTSWGTAFVNGA